MEESNQNTTETQCFSISRTSRSVKNIFRVVYMQITKNFVVERESDILRENLDLRFEQFSRIIQI